VKKPDRTSPLLFQGEKALRTGGEGGQIKTWEPHERKEGKAGRKIQRSDEGKKTSKKLLQLLKKKYGRGWKELK